MRNKTYWVICKIAVLIFLLLTFTPVITPQGIHKPHVMGLPYTLWVGMIQAIVLVGITWFATKIHPGRNE